MQVVSVIPKDLIDDAQRYHIDKNRKDYYKSRTLHGEVVTNNKKNGGIPDALHNLLHTYSSCRESTHQAIHQGKMSGLTTKQ